MGTLVYVCPTTGHQISTGVEVDRSSYKMLPRTKTAIICPRRRRSLRRCTDARPRAGVLRPDRVIFSLPRSH
jgi:hypothetical protein